MWYNRSDIALSTKLDEIIEEMKILLELIEDCSNDADSEFSCDELEKDIKRFIEDWE